MPVSEVLHGGQPLFLLLHLDGRLGGLLHDAEDLLLVARELLLHLDPGRLRDDVCVPDLALVSVAFQMGHLIGCLPNLASLVPIE